MENQEVSLADTFSVSEGDAEMFELTFAASVGIAGPRTVTGNFSAISAALANSTYKPKPAWNSRKSGPDTVKVSISGKMPSASAESVSISIDVVVIAINDAPQIMSHWIGDAIAGSEDVTMNLASLHLNVTDIDVGESDGGFLEVTVHAAHGNLGLGGFGSGLWVIEPADSEFVFSNSIDAFAHEDAGIRDCIPRIR